MTGRGEQVCYGAIPFRALCDRRLSGLALALLGIIAAHDRFGRNGRGCWANDTRLAQLARCSRNAANEATSMLVEYGYISVKEVEGAQADRRRHTYEYRVFYTREDVSSFEARDTGSPAKPARRRKASSRDDTIWCSDDDADPSFADDTSRGNDDDLSSTDDAVAVTNDGHSIEIIDFSRSSGRPNIFSEADEYKKAKAGSPKDQQRLGLGETTRRTEQVRKRPKPTQSEMLGVIEGGASASAKAAEHRWSEDLYRAYGSNLKHCAEVLSAITDETASAATNAELQMPGGGLDVIRRCVEAATAPAPITGAGRPVGRRLGART